MYRISSGISLAVILFLDLAVSSGCGNKALEMNSKWCDREILIDGKNLEWDGGITYFDDPNVAIGQFNDDEYLYLQLSSWDKGIVSHVVRSGVTVWFDPEGGKEKTIGIHYPIRTEDKSLPTKAEFEKDKMGEPPDMLSMMESRMKAMEILAGEDKEAIKLSIAEAGTLGINVSIGFDRRTIVYEMKIPLMRDTDHPFGIGVDLSEISKGEEVKTVGVGIETPELDMSKFKERMGEPPGGGEGMSGGMLGAPPGGAPPSGGGRPGGGPDIKLEPFSLWLLLSLAPKP
jgi:hypothetical protein